MSTQTKEKDMAKAVKTQEPTVLELLFRAAGKSLPAVSNE
jgi:hypothetical protein